MPRMEETEADNTTLPQLNIQSHRINGITQFFCNFKISLANIYAVIAIKLLLLLLSFVALRQIRRPIVSIPKAVTQ